MRTVPVRELGSQFANWDSFIPVSKWHNLSSRTGINREIMNIFSKDDVAFASPRIIFSFSQRMENIVICSDPGGGSCPAMGLQETLGSWAGLHSITFREAARGASTVGGQGVTKCNCNGKCDSNRCSCYKAGRVCNSRCHWGNSKCKNHDDCNEWWLDLGVHVHVLCWFVTCR